MSDELEVIEKMKKSTEQQKVNSFKDIICLSTLLALLNAVLDKIKTVYLTIINPFVKGTLTINQETSEGGTNPKALLDYESLSLSSDSSITRIKNYTSTETTTSSGNITHISNDKKYAHLKIDANAQNDNCYTVAYGVENETDNSYGPYFLIHSENIKKYFYYGTCSGINTVGAINTYSINTQSSIELFEGLIINILFTVDFDGKTKNISFSQNNPKVAYPLAIASNRLIGIAPGSSSTTSFPLDSNGGWRANTLKTYVCLKNSEGNFYFLESNSNNIPIASSSYSGLMSTTHATHLSRASTYYSYETDTQLNVGWFTIATAPYNSAKNSIFLVQASFTTSTGNKFYPHFYFIINSISNSDKATIKYLNGHSEESSNFIDSIRLIRTQDNANIHLQLHSKLSGILTHLAIDRFIGNANWTLKFLTPTSTDLNSNEILGTMHLPSTLSQSPFESIIDVSNKSWSVFSSANNTVMNGLYYKTISGINIGKDENPIIDLYIPESNSEISAEELKSEWSNIIKIEVGENTLTLYSTGQPAYNFQIKMKRFV